MNEDLKNILDGSLDIDEIRRIASDYIERHAALKIENSELQHKVQNLELTLKSISDIIKLLKAY